MKKADILKLTARVKNTQAWKNAATQFDWLFADSLMPPQFRIGKPPTGNEIIKELKVIIAECPAFYPAHFDMALRMLAKDFDKGFKALDTAFDIAMKINTWKTAADTYQVVFGNFNKIYRNELTLHYAQKLIKKYPKKAELYDIAAMSSIVLDENDKAIEYSEKTVELEPDNSYYLNNLGFTYLILKDFENAIDYFEQSIEEDPDNKIPENNLKICEVMQEKDISFDEYCLLPVDPKIISQYCDDDDYEKCTIYVDTINEHKLYVLRKKILKENQFKTHNYHSLLSTLKVFFRFVASVNQEEFVWEDLSFMHLHFKPIMHKFIFKHGDVDDEIMNEVFDSLALFYGFLLEYQVTDASETEEFLRYMDEMKDEMFGKMHRYNGIRHDYGLSDKEKEKVRKKLFGSDHTWMFL